MSGASDAQEAAPVGAVTLRAVAPILPVADVAAAVDWYVRVLGFALGWTWGAPPSIASVCRDGVELLLERRPAGPPAAPGRIYLTMTGVQAFHDRALARGARVTVPLDDREYGMRDARIVDPDGNELSYGEPTG